MARPSIALNGLGLAVIVALGGCAETTSGARAPASAPNPAAASTAPIGDVPQGVTFRGGDGLDCARRVIIEGTDNDVIGVAAEYAWLRSQYPGFKMGMQALSRCDDHPTDKMGIQTAAGLSVVIHFDISAFYGKGKGF